MFFGGEDKVCIHCIDTVMVKSNPPYNYIIIDVSIIIKGFIDRLHVNFDILVILFLFCTFFMRLESAMRSVVIIPRF